jgi:hypothetical protein
MRSVVSVLVVSLAVGAGAMASAPANAGHTVAVQAKQEGVPPGLAKKGGVPPGLAKRFGPSLPAKAYIAVDPRYDDRAWFLIDGRWVLQEGFDADVRLEVRSLAALPPAPQPPPVPLPKLALGFRVVLFD